MSQYKIYQINIGDIRKKVNELGREAASQKFPRFFAYEETNTFGSEKWEPDWFGFYSWVIDLELEDGLYIDELEAVFSILNSDMRGATPVDFFRSLSVGDIVKDVAQKRYYMVDSVGFTEIAVE